MKSNIDETTFFAALATVGVEVYKDKRYWKDQLEAYNDGRRGVDMSLIAMDTLARIEEGDFQED